MPVALVLTLAWGVLAFGAVYPWAYYPLVGAGAILGVWGFTGRPNRRSRGHHEPPARALTLGLLVLILAVALQLVPLPTELLVRISPSTDTFLRFYDVQYAAAAGTPSVAVPRLTTGSDTSARPTHPLSIRPKDTATALALLLGLGVMLLGLPGSLSRREAQTLVQGLVILGVLVALVGIIQRAMFTGKIYGFWIPEAGLLPPSPELSAFGPFINRNHFAGWMLMALPLVLGYFAELLPRGMRGFKPGFRERVLWFASPDANRAILVGFAIMLMGLSLVMTISRSGITCFVVAMVLAASRLARRQSQGSRSKLLITYLVFLALVSVSFGGLDAVLARFSRSSSDLKVRVDAWQDTIQIVHDFPIFGTGLNTYGTATLFYQKSNLDVHLAQAHSDYLQLAAEGGILVGVPAVILVALFIAEVRKRFRQDRSQATVNWLRLGAVTGLVAIALQELVEFSLQMPGNAALFVVLAAIAIHHSPPRRSEPVSP